MITVETDGEPLVDCISDVAGIPKFSSDGIEIFQSDCLAAMRSMPDSCIDLTITSPPYNIGKEYESLLSINEYVVWCKKWIDEIYRLTKPTGAFWLNLGYFELPERAKALPIAYLLWDKIPFYIIQEIVWHYGAGVGCRKVFSPRNEKWLWCVKHPENYTFNLDVVRDPNVKYPNQKKNGKLKCNPLGKNPGDVWIFPKVTSGQGRASKERTDHPAQFPKAVINRIIQACSVQDNLILDPFMGSGSTAECCLLNKRKCIGFEIQEKYINTSVERLKRVAEKVPYMTTQESLF